MQGTGQRFGLLKPRAHQNLIGQSAHQLLGFIYPCYFLRCASSSIVSSFAAELSPYGIEVNCICPNDVDTEGYRNLMAS